MYAPYLDLVPPINENTSFLRAGPGGSASCCRSGSTALDEIEDYNKYLAQSNGDDAAHNNNNNNNNAVENTPRGAEHTNDGPAQTVSQPKGQEGMSEVAPPPARSVEFRPTSGQSPPSSSQGNYPQQLGASRIPLALQAGVRHQSVHPAGSVDNSSRTGGPTWVAG